MAIRRGATPILVITAKDADLIGTTVYVTIAQANGRKLTKMYPNNNGSVTLEASGDDTKVKVFLSQKDTLGFHQGKAEVQLRWIEEDGTAHVSNIKSINLSRTLLEGVIRYVE